VLRLQRRGFYRLPGHPVHTLLKCHIVRTDGAEPRSLRPAVTDLSCGGLSIAVPGSQPELERGSRHECTLELPTVGKIDTAILVHGSRETTLPGGIEGQLYGVEFLNLDAKDVALIQRYIADEERRTRKPRF
jgi:c-di-GMP-binding flagellar brake protein YcgR